MGSIYKNQQYYLLSMRVKKYTYGSIFFGKKPADSVQEVPGSARAVRSVPSAS
jgi:hypothetical protein